MVKKIISCVIAGSILISLPTPQLDAVAYPKSVVSLSEQALTPFSILPTQSRLLISRLALAMLVASAVWAQSFEPKPTASPSGYYSVPTEQGREEALDKLKANESKAAKDTDEKDETGQNEKSSTLTRERRSANTEPLLAIVGIFASFLVVFGAIIYPIGQWIYYRGDPYLDKPLWYWVFRRAAPANFKRKNKNGGPPTNPSAGGSSASSENRTGSRRASPGSLQFLMSA